MTDPRLGIAALLDELQAHGRTHVDDRLRVYESSPGLGTDIDVAEARRVLLSDDPGVSAARRSRYEAIILGQGRPVRPLHTPRDLIRLPPEWVGADNLVDLQVRIVQSAQAVGLLQRRQGLGWTGWGTVFVVRDNGDGTHLAVTNRHVAASLVFNWGERPPEGWDWRLDREDYRVEFGALIEDGVHESIATVDDLLLIHPHWDLAVLRLRGLPASQPVLKLATHPPELGPSGRRRVVVIGHPYGIQAAVSDWPDARDLLFGPDGIKHVHLGHLTALDAPTRVPAGLLSYEGLAARHDAATLEGNSGSPVVDLATGEVVGLHFAGLTRESNFAIQPWDLLSDPRVVATGIFPADAPVGVPDSDVVRAWAALDAADGRPEAVVDGLGGVSIDNIDDASQAWSVGLDRDAGTLAKMAEISEDTVGADVLALIQQFQAQAGGPAVRGGRLNMARHAGGLHSGEVELAVTLEMDQVGADSRALLVGEGQRLGWAVPVDVDDGRVCLRAAVRVPRDSATHFDLWVWPAAPSETDSEEGLEDSNDTRRLNWKRRLRTWTPLNWRKRKVAPIKAESRLWDDIRDSDLPLLLLIHGTGLQTHQGFAGFERAEVEALNNAYCAVLALDHWTLAHGVVDNLRTLARALPATALDKEVHLLSVSRGGLVARALAQYRPNSSQTYDKEIDGLLGGHRLYVRRLFMVAAPHRGTELARLVLKSGFLRSLHYRKVPPQDLPCGPVLEQADRGPAGIDHQIAALTRVRTGVYQGRRDMVPGSALQDWLNNKSVRAWKGKPGRPRLIVTAHCQTRRKPFDADDKELLDDKLGRNHDIMVGRASARGPFQSPEHPWGPPVRFDHQHHEVDPRVDHHHYFLDCGLRARICAVLTGAEPPESS